MRYIKIILKFIPVVIFLYMVFALSEGNINPAKWESIVRMTMGFYCICILLLLILINSIHDNKGKDRE